MGSTIIAAPRISRGRASGSGSVRISSTATAASAIGNKTTEEPMSTRRKVSIHAPTGRAAPNQELAAITTAMPSSASAMPSRRCPGSRSRALPTERAVEPAPLASISQPARTPRPTVVPADETGEGFRRGAGFRRGVVRVPAREPVFDLLERLPDRAAVLLGMSVRLVANAPETPSATRVTETYQSSRFGDVIAAVIVGPTRRDRRVAEI